MRLLLDQNISYRVVKGLLKSFPEITQVKELGLENASDLEIWNYAKKYKYTIVTFDADFYDLALLKGIPPKIIWLRTGNTSTKNIIKLIIDNHFIITEFITNKEYKDVDCIEIY